MSLESLEKKLYKRDNEQQKKKTAREPDQKRTFNNKGSRLGRRERFGWNDSQNFDEVEVRQKSKKKRFSWKQWLVFGALFFFVASFVVGGFYLYKAFYSEGVDVLISFPEGKIYYGMPFKIEAAIQNYSGKVLKEVSLGLSLPDGIAFLEESAGQKIVTRQLGSIGDGSLAKQEFLVVATPTTVTEIKRVDAIAAYETSTVGSKFEERMTREVSVADPAVFADLVLPEKVYSGEDFEIIIPYRNLLEDLASDFIMEIEYPEGFVVKESEPMLEGAAQNVLIFDTMESGEEGRLVITGSVAGPSSSFFEMKATIKRKIGGETYDVFSIAKGFSIQSSPLSLHMTVNDSSDYVAKTSDNLRYTIAYENNTGVALRDVIITAELQGDMFDLTSLNTSGFFNSITRTITWNASNVRSLASIPSGTSGVVTFNISTKRAYPIFKLNDKNFTLRVSSQMESPTVAEGVGAFKTVAVAENEVKVRGRVEVESKVLFRDSASGTVNDGAWPPQANQSTEFTVHWIITNYATDVTNVSVKSFLNPGVKWVGNIKGNTSTLPEYSERTQEIVWKIDSVGATKGVVGSPIEVVFQVELTPSTLSIGNYAPIIGQTELSAVDSFTGLVLTSTDEAVTTRLPDDSTVNEQQGRVTQSNE